MTSINAAFLTNNVMRKAASSHFHALPWVSKSCGRSQLWQDCSNTPLMDMLTGSLPSSKGSFDLSQRIRAWTRYQTLFSAVQSSRVLCMPFCNSLKPYKIEISGASLLCTHAVVIALPLTCPPQTPAPGQLHPARAPNGLIRPRHARVMPAEILSVNKTMQSKHALVRDHMVCAVHANLGCPLKHAPACTRLLPLN